MTLQTTPISEKKNSIDSLKCIENKFFSSTLSEEKRQVKIGDILRIGYLIPEGQKERTQQYEGLVIAQNGRGSKRSFTLRRTVQGIGLEQVFFLNSPKLVSIVTKQHSKVRRSKLYFIRALTGKKARLKTKF